MELTVHLELARVDGYRARRPFVAIWIEDKDKSPVRLLALWYQKSRYASELKAWWKSDTFGRRRPPFRALPGRPVSTPSGGTADNSGKYVKAGKYTVYIEASREHGTYQLIRGEMDFSGTPQQTQLRAARELLRLRSNTARPVSETDLRVHRFKVLVFFRNAVSYEVAVNPFDHVTAQPGGFSPLAPRLQHGRDAFGRTFAELVLNFAAARTYSTRPAISATISRSMALVAGADLIETRAMAGATGARNQLHYGSLRAVLIEGLSERARDLERVARLDVPPVHDPHWLAVAEESDGGEDGG